MCEKDVEQKNANANAPTVSLHDSTFIVFDLPVLFALWAGNVASPKAGVAWPRCQAMLHVVEEMLHLDRSRTRRTHKVTCGLDKVGHAFLWIIVGHHHS